MSIQETDTPLEERHLGELKQSTAPSIDPYDDREFIDRDREMRGLDMAAMVVGTVMALGPLTVFTIFGS
jgi:hypothetical protein